MSSIVDRGTAKFNVSLAAMGNGATDSYFVRHVAGNQVVDHDNTSRLFVDATYSSGTDVGSGAVREGVDIASFCPELI
jgi:hypothetical protein